MQILRCAFDNVDVLTFDFLGGGGHAAGNNLKWATDAETLYSLHVFKKDFVGTMAWIRMVAAPAIKDRVFRRQPIKP